MRGYLVQHGKALYRDLCSQEQTIPIFSKDWWLDAVCGDDNWNVALVEENGEIVASMPYYFVKNLGLMQITMPMLTQTMGPWIKYPPGQKYASRLSYEKKVFTELIDQLPEFASFNQNFHYFVTNWLPFYWRGFKQTTRYTYVIEELSDLDGVFAHFKKHLRKEIRKVETDLEVVQDNDIERFYHINKLSFHRQNRKIPYNLKYVKNINNACEKNKCRTIFFAKDKNDNYHAALFLIWDNMSAYDLLGGADPRYKSSNAKSLITWEAIQYASGVTNKFDFEGSMMENVEQFIRGFGAIQKPYFNLSKVNSKLIMLKNSLSNFLR